MVRYRRTYAGYDGHFCGIDSNWCRFSVRIILLQELEDISDLGNNLPVRGISFVS